MKLVWLLSVAALFGGALCISGRYSGNSTLVYVLKPLTTLLIIGVAALLAQPTFSSYAILVVCGLVFCLFGDVFLMLPQDRFLAGLVSFLVGHLCFAAAFSIGGLRVTWWLLALVLAPAALIFGWLAPGLGPLRYPVMVYVTVIAVMTWLAWERWHMGGDVAALAAAVGATLFMVSDTALAANKFRTPFRSAELLILGTYYTAIWLIALSVAAGGTTLSAASST